MLEAAKKDVVRRRGTLEQGRALESLGHAVEYLLDSRMFLIDFQAERNSEDAVALLKLASRAVFAECPEVVPVRKRLGRWMASRIPRNRTPDRMAERANV